MGPPQRGRPVWVLTGPTGTGKSDWALAAGAAPSPLKSLASDSAMVYRGLDNRHGQNRRALCGELIPHHLIDVCEATERYSAGRFRRRCHRKGH